MPNVNGKKFPYTSAGKSAAKKAMGMMGGGMPMKPTMMKNGGPLIPDTAAKMKNGGKAKKMKDGGAAMKPMGNCGLFGRK